MLCFSSSRSKIEQQRWAGQTSCVPLRGKRPTLRAARKFSFPPQPLLGIFLTATNEPTAIPTSGRGTCPLTTGLLPPTGWTHGTPRDETALAAHRQPAQRSAARTRAWQLPGPSRSLLQQDEKARLLFNVCPCLSFAWEITSR